MATTKKTPRTYTHTGYIPQVGHYRWDGDTDTNPGKSHAISEIGDNGHGVTLCGDVLMAQYVCPISGQDIKTIDESEKRDGSDVTCARCRAALGLRRWHVQVPSRYFRRRWASLNDHSHYTTKKEAEQAMATLAEQYPTARLRVRMV